MNIESKNLPTNLPKRVILTRKANYARSLLKFNSLEKFEDKFGSLVRNLKKLFKLCFKAFFYLIQQFMTSLKLGQKKKNFSLSEEKCCTICPKLIFINSHETQKKLGGIIPWR